MSAANSPALPTQVLFVGLGSRGGAGRYEQLLCSALDELADRGAVEWRGVWRRQYPEYLAPSPPQEGSISALVSRIFRSTRDWRPDVVCFSHVNLARLEPLMRLLGIHAPYVVSALGVEVWDRLHWTKRRPLTRAALVLAISEYTRSQVIHVQDVRADRCRTVHLALEDHWLASAEAAGAAGAAHKTGKAPARAFSLLSVCRLESSARDKGVDWVLDAMASLLPAQPGLRYTIVGDGDDLPYLKRRAALLGIEPSVCFTGSLSHSELLAAYRDCDLFVLPSRREGFGLVFLEAMAFHRPIVAMARAGTLDVVTDGERGILINDQDELAGAIEAVINDPERARRMGEAGHAAVLGPFSFDSFVSRLSAAIADTVRDHWHEREITHRVMPTRP